MERTIELVAHELHETKEQLKRLGEAKLCLEGELAGLVGQKEEGTTSIKTDKFKVSTVGALRRSVMPEVERESFINVLGEDITDRLVKVSFSLSTSEYRKLTDEQRDAIAHFIISKPAKLAVNLEVLGNE